MQISMAVDADALLAAFRKAPLTVSKNLRVELNKGMQEVARQARQNHRFKSKSGMANRSIKHMVSGDGMEGRVYLDSGVAKYAEYQHEGTGRYGPKHRDYKVRAVGKKALFWTKGGQKFFVPKKPYIGPDQKNPFWVGIAKGGANVIWKGHVIIKGIRPDKFLYRAFAAQKPYLIARMRGAVDAAIRMSGFKGVA